MFSSNTSQVVATSTQAEAVDFDGTNDYLSRSTDLVGNTDGKTFTFSAWVWWGGSANLEAIYIASTAGDSSYGLDIYIDSGGAGQPRVLAKNSAGTTILRMDSGVYFSKNTFNHFLISVDLTNTANRYVYINDVLTSPTWVTYTNDFIDNTRQYHGVGASGATGSYKCLDRLSNVFLDYTYRDLSVEASRRLFITADLKPAAGQAALNPILYLPMSDPTTVGTNAGTGGNFTLTGTIARSGRGPNQYNAPYSTFDGSADYLSRTTALTGVTASKEFTVSFCFSKNSGIEGTPIELTTTGGYGRFTVYYYNTNLYLYAWDSSNAVIIEASISMSLVTGRNYVVTISCDTTSTSKRHVYINGQAATVSWSSYVNNTIPFNTASPTWRLGVTVFNNTWLNGKMGAFYLSTSYIDLSVASNLAKFVTGTGIDAKPVDLGANGELPTGTSPLIYLPMYGNNAGKNYGTGGDFTVNSGPYTGARGPNEFWGNKADFNGSTGYLSRTSALAGVSNGKVVSGCIWITMDDISTPRIFQIFTNAGSASSGKRFMIYATSGTLYIEGYNSAGTQILLASKAAAFSADVTYCLHFCIDLSNASNRAVYLNGVSQSMTWTTYSNDSMELSAPRVTVGANWTGSLYNIFYDGKLCEFYFTTDYIDFSQETNRLKFRDCFGNPTDLPSAITAQSVPNPAIYMRFDPASFGTNSGTGGNFTVNGTITDGGQL